MWLVFLIHPNNINLIHRGRSKVSASVRCLVLVKTYGNNPTNLFVRIMRNSDVRMSFLYFRKLSANLYDIYHC